MIAEIEPLRLQFPCDQVIVQCNLGIAIDWNPIDCLPYLPAVLQRKAVGHHNPVIPENLYVVVMGYCCYKAVVLGDNECKPQTSVRNEMRLARRYTTKARDSRRFIVEGNRYQSVTLLIPLKLKES